MSAESLLIVFAVALILALITCFAVKSSMKTARIKNAATEYITEEGVDYRIRTTHFSHRTRTVVKIPKKD